MQFQFWVSRLSILLLVLIGSVAGQGWGQALPFATGNASADYLAVPVSQDAALLPETTRLVASLKWDETDAPAEALPDRVTSVGLVSYSNGYSAVRSDTPRVHLRTIGSSAPRAPPAA